MGLRIRTNVPALRAQRNLASVTGALQDNMEKMSSGFRINKSADDAAGLAIAETLGSKIRSVDQARRNASDGVSLIQVAEGSMQEMTNIMIRMRELATQASSDTIGNLERSYANMEYRELVQEIDRISNSTEFNGVNLLGGAEANNGLTSLTIHVGAGDGTQANTDTILFDVEAIKVKALETLGFTSEAEIGPTDPTDTSFSRETAASKLTLIDTAIKKIAGNRAVLGAKQSRLTSTINNLGVQLENMSTSRSRIKDLDFASEVASLTQNKIIAQAGASVLSQANSVPELALGLLRN